jgi:hypothetical protein
VLSTEPILVDPGSVTVPVKVGEAIGDLVSICPWTEDVTPSRYPISVLPTEPILVDPGRVTVPVSVGEAIGA